MSRSASAPDVAGIATDAGGGLRLLIVDDHPMTCAGLQALLHSRYPQAVIDVRHEAAALSQAARGYDWLFLDMHLPGVAFVDLLTELHGLSERLILISANPEPEIVEQARALGVRGLLLKNADAALLLDDFRRIRGGERVFGESASLIGGLRPPAELTARQREIYQALLGGLSNKQIARKFDISEYTVKEHVTAVLNHFGVRNRLELLLQQRRPPIV